VLFSEASGLDSGSNVIKISDQSTSVHAVNNLDQLSCVFEDDLGRIWIQLSIDQSDFFLSRRPASVLQCSDSTVECFINSVVDMAYVALCL
jgi:hypothetical protein